MKANVLIVSISKARIIMDGEELEALSSYEEDPQLVRRTVRMVWDAVCSRAQGMDDGADDDSAHHDPAGRVDTLSLDEVLAVMDGLVSQLNEWTSVGEDAALAVLVARRWQIDSCITELTENPSKIQREARGSRVLCILCLTIQQLGIMLSAPSEEGRRRRKLTPEPPAECSVCMENLDDTSPRPLACQHRACRACWAQYLELAVLEQRRACV